MSFDISKNVNVNFDTLETERTHFVSRLRRIETSKSILLFTSRSPQIGVATGRHFTT